jgi:phenylpyruvate tautomerase PptA (4-oxalocrotonate tautomerase family)
LHIDTFGPIIESMPLVRIVTSVALGPDKKADELLSKISQTAAKQFEKPERWVMTCLDTTAKMTFAGSTEPCCYIEIKNIGSMTSELTEQISQEISQLITQFFGIPSSRVYIEFAEAKAHLWGWDGSTFA